MDRVYKNFSDARAFELVLSVRPKFSSVYAYLFFWKVPCSTTPPVNLHVAPVPTLFLLPSNEPYTFLNRPTVRSSEDGVLTHFYFVQQAIHKIVS